MCGDFYVGTISNCYNTGTVEGKGYYVGGVCGWNDSVTVSNCYYLTGCAKDGGSTGQFGIGNYTQGSTTADVADQTLGLSDAKMKSTTATITGGNYSGKTFLGALNASAKAYNSATSAPAIRACSWTQAADGKSVSGEGTGRGSQGQSWTTISEMSLTTIWILPW